jgi:hypothetical protein
MKPEQAMQMANRIVAVGRRATPEEFDAFIAVTGPTRPVEWDEDLRHHVRRWPVEEFLMRNPCTRSVRERVLRLNPEGQREGCYPRGWHPQRVVAARRIDSYRTHRPEAAE